MLCSLTLTGSLFTISWPIDQRAFVLLQGESCDLAVSHVERVHSTRHSPEHQRGRREGTVKDDDEDEQEGGTRDVGVEDGKKDRDRERG